MLAALRGEAYEEFRLSENGLTNLKGTWLMKSGRGVSICGLPWWKTALVLLLVTSPGLSTARTTEKTANVLILDTQSPFVNKVDLQDRADWKVVPTDLLSLELDPLTAFSDPGYYGREYAFKGDAVVENEHLTAAFFSKKRRGSHLLKSRSFREQNHINSSRTEG